LLEQVADARCANADEHLDEIRARHREEGTTGLTGYRSREQRLASTRRADQQRALRDPAAEPGEPLGILQELDDLLQLVLRLVCARDVLEGDLRGIRRQQLRLRLPELERLGATGLHLSDDEDPEGDDEEPGEHAEDDAPPVPLRAAGI